jgi:hypothetical protein
VYKTAHNRIQPEVDGDRDFLADAGNRQKLQEALGFSGSPTQPVYFEALIRTQAVAGAPNATSVVATRVIRP